MYGQIFLSKILGRQYQYLAYTSIVDLTPKSVNKRNIHAQFMAEHENIRKQNASKFVDQIGCFRSNGLQMTAFCVPESEKGRYNFCL